MPIIRLPQCALWTALLTAFATAQHTPYAIVGATPFGRFGSALAFVSDLDNDGSEELAVGSPSFTNSMGLVVGRVEVFNRSGAVLWATDGATFNEQFGYDLDRVPDVDGDGFDELLVGAWGSSATGLQAGRACLLSGATGVELWSVSGPQSLARFGFAVAFAGHLLRFALARELEPADWLAVEAIAAEAEPGGYRLQTLLGAVATSDAFTRR